MPRDRAPVRRTFISVVGRLSLRRLGSVGGNAEVTDGRVAETVHGGMVSRLEIKRKCGKTDTRRP